MTQSLIGRLSLTAAAMADVLAWIMLALALMELIVMKVGLDAGVIGPELFTMLMVMAILTTFMTGPLLRLFAGKDGTQGGGSADTVARP